MVQISSLPLLRKSAPTHPETRLFSRSELLDLYVLEDLTLGAAYAEAWEMLLQGEEYSPHFDELLKATSLDLRVLRVLYGGHWPWYYNSEGLECTAEKRHTPAKLTDIGRNLRAMLPPLPPRDAYALAADSPLEEAFVWKILTPAALPGIIGHVMPQHQVLCGTRAYRIDYVLVGRYRIAVELDGYAYHGALDAFTADRLRQNDLVIAGYSILRFTHDAIHHDAPRCMAQLQALMRRDPLLCEYVDSAPRVDVPHNGGRP